MLISLIICTYNRAELLKETLVSLNNLTISENELEILIVDNNSIDNTSEVVTTFSKNAKFLVKYVYEPRQGLSYARNMGIETSAGDYIVFTDDDVDASPDWLSELLSSFLDDKVLAAGGPIHPIWLGEKPDWLADWLLSYLSIYDYNYAETTHVLTGPYYPCGVNMAFRRQVFREFGLFPHNLGRMGRNLLSNEESHLFRSIENSGAIIGFAPRAVIHHKIPSERLTKQWFLHRFFWQGRSDAILDASTPDFHKKCIDKTETYFENLKSKEHAGFDIKLCRKYFIGYISQAVAGGEGENIRALLDVIYVLEELVSRLYKESIDLNHVLLEKDSRLTALLDSMSWKITKPLRYFASLCLKH